jgi:hypothetical protein
MLLPHALQKTKDTRKASSRALSLAGVTTGQPNPGRVRHSQSRGRLLTGGAGGWKHVWMVA